MHKFQNCHEKIILSFKNFCLLFFSIYSNISRRTEKVILL